MKAKSFFYFVVLSILVFGCEKYDGSNTIVGIWQCKEITSNGIYKVYDVSIEPDGKNDSTRFWVFNFYNVGMDFKTLISLDDSTFTILSSNYSQYNIQGTGKFHKKPFSIDWVYSISGDPNVQARFEKP